MVAVMAVQATDKEHAVVGVRALRALLAAHRAAAHLTPAPGSPAPRVDHDLRQVTVSWRQRHDRAAVART